MTPAEYTDVRREPAIVGAALGNCVHVAGVANFLRLAEANGFDTHMLGAAVPISRILAAVDEIRPRALAVSYRLTSAGGRVLLDALIREIEARSSARDMVVLFGGTPEMVEIARKMPRIAACFAGGEPPAAAQRAFAMLRGGDVSLAGRAIAVSELPIGERIGALMKTGQGRPVPLLRHHFGLPDLAATIAGVSRIAESEAVDVISIAPDQNAQEFFFRPEQMEPSLDGAGGVPVRSRDDLARLYEASRRGNHPYLRIYSGTQDLLKWAEMSVECLHNAWGAIPLTWYSELDGRSRRPLENAIAENVSVMRWYAGRNIPVEVNESHQWSLREAPDCVAVAMAYIAARIARKAGVRRFFAQYMFNTPSFTSPVADLAKMMAKLALIETLRTDSFTPFRQVRAGLTHFTSNPDVAKGQLGVATTVMLALQPHIVHVVGFPEADHAALPDEVVESCRIVQGVLRNTGLGMPNLLADPAVKGICDQLLHDSMLLLGAIESLGAALGREDPLTDPETIARALRAGILDAPHLAGQPCARGRVRTAPVRGGCRAVDRSGVPIAEADRLIAVFREIPGMSDLGDRLRAFETSMPVEGALRRALPND